MSYYYCNVRKRVTVDEEDDDIPRGDWSRAAHAREKRTDRRENLSPSVLPLKAEALGFKVFAVLAIFRISISELQALVAFFFWFSVFIEK